MNEVRRKCLFFQQINDTKIFFLKILRKKIPQTKLDVLPSDIRSDLGASAPEPDNYKMHFADLLQKTGVKSLDCLELLLAKGSPACGGYSDVIKDKMEDLRKKTERGTYYILTLAFGGNSTFYTKVSFCYSFPDVN